ncbi:hypothetical protein HKX48_004369 [Thoreauomyces humboldtii]|nr:hypothetical protein HKX48_004354 [Thoreauomyces humboldtii]KAJ3023075.1 hypothetical protein HKX48_004369 [Thoreauomyces humboldtii]
MAAQLRRATEPYSWDGGVTSDSLLRQDAVEDLTSLGLPVIAAKDIVSCFKRDEAAEAIVYWDIENLAIPSDLSASETVNRIKAGLRSYGLMKSTIQVYGEHKQPAKYKRADLVQSGCSFLDTPHDGTKEIADKLLIADVLFWAMDHPPPVKIVLMCGDKDLSYVIARLCDRKFFVVLVHGRDCADRLKRAASKTIPWELLLNAPEEDVAIDDDDDAGGLVAKPLGSVEVPLERPGSALHVEVDEDSNEVVSVTGSSTEAQQNQLLASGVVQLVEVLLELDKAKKNVNPADRWHKTTLVAARLWDKYPLLRQRYPVSLKPLYQRAKSEGAVDVSHEEGATGIKHYRLKLTTTLTEPSSSVASPYDGLGM